MHVESSVLKRFSELTAAHTPECSVQYSVYAEFKNIYRYPRPKSKDQSSTRQLHSWGGQQELPNMAAAILGELCLGGSYAVAAVTHQRHDTWQLAGALGVALSALFKL